MAAHSHYSLSFLPAEQCIVQGDNEVTLLTGWPASFFCSFLALLYFAYLRTICEVKNYQREAVVWAT
jgi:hypothetical protein